MALALVVWGAGALGLLASQDGCTHDLPYQMWATAQRAGITTANLMWYVCASRFMC